MSNLKLDERIEKKYIIKNEVAEFILDIICCYGEKRSYHVSSDYYDTKERDLLNQKLDGNYQKLKLRKRTYNKNESYFEVKIKNGLPNYKQRFFNLSDAWAFLRARSKQSLSSLIPYPVIQVEYDRVAFEVGKDLRVTLDQNIKYCNLLTKKTHQNIGICILEVKGWHIPDWLSILLKRVNVGPSPYSKYQVAHEKTC